MLPIDRAFLGLDPHARTRFLRFVTIEDSGCWFWTGQKVIGGYGRFFLAGTNLLAHRVAYESCIATIPAGLTIDHLCGNPSCVNPKHLEPVTQAENNRRAGLGWWWSERDRCVNGHGFTAENTRVNITPSGGCVRHCRACQRDRTRKYRSKLGALA